MERTDTERKKEVQMRPNFTRREFLKLSATATSASCLGSLSGCGLFDSRSSQASNLVRFGNTDLFVSRLCQGTAFRKVSRRGDDPEGLAILHHSIDIGVNFFDTAEAYGWGGSESLLGKAVAGRRDQIVIATKATPHVKDSSAKTPFTRDLLFAKAEGSLRRLGTDYIDIFLLHDEDDVTSAEDIADAMDALVKSGKIRYWGVSNHRPQLVSQLVELGKRSGTAPLAGLEDYYNIAGGYSLTPDGQSRIRRYERQMFPVVSQYGLGTMFVSPLDVAQLATSHEPEPGSPLATLRAELDAIAEQLGATRAQICVAWVLDHPEASTVLAGPEHPDHVDELLAGINLQLPADVRERLDQASMAYSQSLAIEREE